MFKFLSIFTKFSVIIFILLFILLYITDNQYIIKAIRQTYMRGNKTACVDDWRIFSNNVIKIGEKTFKWPLDSDYNKIPLEPALKERLNKNSTLSFIIVKEGKLFFEKYWADHDKKSISNAFSVAKSVVTLLLGFAIQDGYIKDLDQPILDFLPEYKNIPFSDQVRVGDLSRMSSGLEWNESYRSPLNPTTKAYYGTHLEEQVLSKKFIEKPGKRFNYLSINTEILAILIRRATGKTLAKYTQEKIWEPLGMEQSALWGLDDEAGVEKAFCCLYASARDYAKLGQFLLQKGKWNGQQLLNEDFVEKMTHPALSPEYGYGTWMDYGHKPAFFAYVGLLGQYIICVPEKKVVIVRVGKNADNTLKKGKKHLRKELYFYLTQGLKMTDI